MIDIYISNQQLEAAGCAVWSTDTQLLVTFIKPGSRHLFTVDRNQLGVTFKPRMEGRSH